MMHTKIFAETNQSEEHKTYFKVCYAATHSPAMYRYVLQVHKLGHTQAMRPVQPSSQGHRLYIGYQIQQGSQHILYKPIVVCAIVFPFIHSFIPNSVLHHVTNLVPKKKITRNYLCIFFFFVTAFLYNQFLSLGEFLFFAVVAALIYLLKYSLS